MKRAPGAIEEISAHPSREVPSMRWSSCERWDRSLSRNVVSPPWMWVVAMSSIAACWGPGARRLRRGPRVAAMPPASVRRMRDWRLRGRTRVIRLRMRVMMVRTPAAPARIETAPTVTAAPAQAKSMLIAATVPALAAPAVFVPAVQPPIDPHDRRLVDRPQVTGHPGSLWTDPFLGDRRAREAYRQHSDGK